ncbi:MAG TPA: hypothetical protein VEM96_16015 [Pyrinomonadaceae bacterium]|nr:hypothetical protein [Pyrinomonadaceae bacterium]
MKLSLVSRFIQSSFLLILLAACGLAQADKPQADKPKTDTDDKAAQILRRAIQAVGGDRYLAVRTLIGRGFFTDYKDGVPGIPTKFVDYIAYPDRERTEFTGGGARLIQTNDRDKGWIYDGAALTLKDQNAGQLEDFRMAMRTSAENLLRGWWRKDGATLSYIGRREAGLARRNETVRLTYPGGLWIEYEFAATDGLPAKVLYQRKQKKPDSDEMENISEEDRLFKPVTIDGVVAPYVIDHYRNGTQTSRINYESVEFNKPIADSLFAKPANLKAIK